MLFKYILTVKEPRSSFYRFDMHRHGKCFIINLKSSLTLWQIRKMQMQALLLTREEMKEFLTYL